MKIKSTVNKKLVTLDSWNENHSSIYNSTPDPRLNGIVCPQCKAEMYDLGHGWANNVGNFVDVGCKCGFQSSRRA